VDLRVKAALTSILVNVLLVALKMFLARISGSASIHADAWHSISDLVVSVFVLTGLTVRTTGERNKLVNWRGLEDVVALVVGLFIVYAGWVIFRDALVQPAAQIRNLGWVIAGAVGCVFASYSIATMKLNVGRLKDSPSLIADGYHSKMDMYSTIAVVIGLFGVMIGIDLDRPAAAVVAIMIALTGVEIVVGSARAITRGTAITDYFLSIAFERAPSQRRGGRLAEAAREGLAWLRRGRRYVYVMAALALLLWLGSGLFIVRYGETGMVFRFGKLTRAAVPAGIHFHAPAPIDRLVRVSAAVRRVEVGFRTVPDTTGTARGYEWESRHQAGGYLKVLDESLVFTGDENIIDVNAVIQYRVRQPVSFVLNVEVPQALVRSLGEASLRRVLSILPIDDVLTIDRTGVEGQVLDMLQQLVDQSGAGIEVIAVKLQDVHPPTEVVSAREDMSKLVNQAEAYKDSLLPDIRGQAAQMLAEAQAQRTESVEHATGEAGRFLAVVSQYQRSKDVTELRLYLETVEKALPGVEKFIIEPQANGEPVDLRFFDENVLGTRGGW
jgi:membrane protease subunit HflK